MKRKYVSAVIAFSLFIAMAGQSSAVAGKSMAAMAGMGAKPAAMTPLQMMERRTTAAQRQAAARNAAAKGLHTASSRLLRPGMTVKQKANALKLARSILADATIPDYFGPYPNYANSPLPTPDGLGGVVSGTGIRKFVDTLPGLGASNQNDLNNYIPVATPDTITYPGSDYYVIAVKQYTQQLHKDLPATTLRGYVQLNNGTDGSGHNTVVPPTTPYFLGPFIQANAGTPVRILFVNQLPTGTNGSLFLPVDSTLMGAGTGPKGGSELYSENRAGIHLHGGFTPWISDGTPHQWTTPANQTTSYPKGVSVSYVPDMWYDANGLQVPSGTPGATNNPGPGKMTLFYTNQQSARLMFYHDHTNGLTRLNVYAGEAAGYLLNDPTEQQMVTDGVIPSSQIPLVIQDKTFVPATTQLAAEDPTWDASAWGGKGALWFPHVYMTNQDPYDDSGATAMGRWDYGPWFWPPYTGLTHGPVANPLYNPGSAAWEPPMNPATPNVSAVPESFMDTPLVNGTAYPSLTIEPKAYRFRILNASNDRFLNLQLYYAKSNAAMWNPDGTLNDANAGEVNMVAAVSTPGYPATWPTDGRDGGVPDPAAVGPNMIQIGTEGGLLPAPVVIPNQPVNYIYNRRDIVVLNISTHALLLGPAERADVIVDFSAVPPGSKLILYNDAPAPVPAFDPRNDYYTGDPDQTTTGGAPTTLPGYGPNTRTIMQIAVAGTPAAAFNVGNLNTRLPLAYRATQPAPIVPEKAYDAAFGTTTAKNTYVKIQDNYSTFTPVGTISTPAPAPVTMPLQPKAIQELFDVDYGRMNSTLGVELPFTSATTQTTIPLGFIDPVTEVINPSDVGQPVGSLNDGTQIWKITHNGVDTHAIHFHLFDVQLINRVGWDGAIRPPDANELGWKETVRMNPLEDAIVALRPTVPTLPFKIPDSIRPLDPTQPLGATMGFMNIDPLTGNAPTVRVTNQLYNFGWEYVWHCHLLGHEENDMMRPIEFKVSPAGPTNLSAAESLSGPRTVTLTWTNNWNTHPIPTATNITLERATDYAFTQNVVDVSRPAAAVSYVDSTVVSGTSYFYRVREENTVSISAWSNLVLTPPLTAPTNLRGTVSTSAPLSVAFTWTSPTSAVTGFELQRAANSTFTTSVTSFTGGATAAYTDTGAAANTTYYYRVRSTVGTFVSPWSSVVMVTTPAIPAMPTNLQLSVTAVNGPPKTARITVTWSESGASTVGGFTLQRATNSSFSTGLTTIAVAGNLRTYSDSGLARNTRYYYRILAYNGAGSSAYTASVNLTTPV